MTYRKLAVQTTNPVFIQQKTEKNDRRTNTTEATENMEIPNQRSKTQKTSGTKRGRMVR